MTIFKKHLVLGISILVITIFFGTGLLLFHIYPRGGHVYSLQKIGVNEYQAIESAFRVKFPEGTSIKNASLVGGKDWTLYVRLTIPSNKKEKFISDINFNYEVEPPNELMLSHPSLSWWTIDQRKLQSILSETSGLTQIRFCKQESNKQTVFMFTDGGKNGFSKEFWGLFNKR